MSHSTGYNNLRGSAYYNLPPPNVLPPPLSSAPPPPPPPPPSTPAYQESYEPPYYPPPNVDISRPPPFELDKYVSDNQCTEYRSFSFPGNSFPLSENNSVADHYSHQPLPIDMSRPPPPVSSRHRRSNDRTYTYDKRDDRKPSTSRSRDRDSRDYHSSSRDRRDNKTDREHKRYKETDREHKGYKESRKEIERRDRGRKSRESSTGRYSYSESRYSRSSRESSYSSQRHRSNDSRYSKSSVSRDRHSHSRQHERELRRSESRAADRREKSPRKIAPRIEQSVPPRAKSPYTCSQDLVRDAKQPTEEKISHQSRYDYCSNMDEVYEKMDKNVNDESDEEEKRWYRSSPADLYYTAVPSKKNVMESTAKGKRLAEQVREKLIERGQKARPPPGAEPLAPPKCHKPRLCKHKSEQVSSSNSSSSSESECDEADRAMQELERKQQHPRRLHPEMWYNDSGEMNDGPLCRCSARTRRQGIRHGVYANESRPPLCDPFTNNADKLYHYSITISPPTNFLIKTLTVITHDEHEFLFSGFSLLSHYPLTKLPPCKVIRFNIEYTILYAEEQSPLNYTVEELELFKEFLFLEVLELVDLDIGKRDADGCSQFHLLPRWERSVGAGGGEVLAMSEVLRYLLRAGGELLPASALPALHAANEREWQIFVDKVRGMIVTYPGKKPCSVRVDQLDRSLSDEDTKGTKDSTSTSEPNGSDQIYPEIVHFGIRPPQLSYAGNPEYKKAWRDYVKYRHLVANMAKPTYEDKRKLEAKEARLQEMRTQSKMKRDVTIAVSAEGFYRTGLMCDVVQHAMLIPVLISHLRFHNSLQSLENIVQYKFENRSLLQLALTHPSYRENFGTNPDHARNSLTNCGIRQPEYGDRRIHYMNIRKRGINTLINIMSRFGKKQETESAINHNERLEFLGDAVVEFLSSIHLFRMFPSLEEGGLATYRAAIVQNQHLAVLAKKLGLEQFMLYAHGSDLCHDLELRHAMANCFEALMGALFLDGGIDVADRVFALALWGDDPVMLETWNKPRLHLLQEQEPLGDRRWIPQYPFLQKLTEFEKSIGVEFKHIRLLARAFTDRSMGFTNLTLGSNQRLEFLGDTVLQLISSEYLYKHFPEHHEGHLSLLRSSLVNNRTQAVVCDDLAMCNYAVYHNPKAEPKTKDKADLLEAFLGALYIEKNLVYCHTFCSVCLFPRLREFIMNQEWNDPKSKLQQCCLTLRTMDGSEPDIPIYKVIECVGPTNTRVYTVAVYFRGERLASARGHYIQEAEMNAAKAALANSQNLFPQLDHQKRVIAESMRHQKRDNKQAKYKMKKRLGYKEGSPNRSEHSEEAGKRKGSSRFVSNRGKESGLRASFSRRQEKLPKAYRLDKRDTDSDSLSDAVASDVSVHEAIISSQDSDEDLVRHKKKRSSRSPRERSVSEKSCESGERDDESLVAQVMGDISE